MSVWDRLEDKRRETLEESILFARAINAVGSSDESEKELGGKSFIEFRRRVWIRSGSELDFHDWMAAEDKRREAEREEDERFEMRPRIYDGDPPTDAEVEEWIENHPSPEDVEEDWREAETGQTLVEFVRSFLYRSTEEERERIATMTDDDLIDRIALMECLPGGVGFPDPDPWVVRRHCEFMTELIQRHGPDRRSDGPRA